MARCANCGCEIPNEEKTRLCDNCKRILLPFVKLMDASSTSAVRRLVSNEGNLRKAGATDGGMEYLYRICELHDRQRQAMRAERAAKAEALRDEQLAQAAQRALQPDPRGPMEEMELPPEEPLRLHSDAVGKHLSVAKVVLYASGVMQIVWFVWRIVGKLGMDATPLLSGASSLAAGYAVGAAEKLREDLNEIKRHFR